MFAFTGTPLGRMLNAVRDNPERVAFVGYNTQRVRYLGFIIAGFFAGIGGGLAAINFEIITAMDSVSVVRWAATCCSPSWAVPPSSSAPSSARVLMVLATVLLSELTKAWLLYLGLVFLFMVMYAPGGVASLIMMNLRAGQVRAMLGAARRAYLALGGTAVVAVVGGGGDDGDDLSPAAQRGLGRTLPFMGTHAGHRCRRRPGRWPMWCF